MSILSEIRVSNVDYDINDKRIDSSKITEWNGKVQQYSSMPSASSEYSGKIVQFIGATDGNYTNGYFYKCSESGGVYSWGRVNVQPSSSGGTSNWGQIGGNLSDQTDLQTALNGKVSAVEGKCLSTNDYDATAKAKVDAIPANPKYTDTVYDDTAIKARVSTIEGKESGWDAKYTKPASGIPASDLASGVIPDVTGKQDKTDNDLTTTSKTIVGAINEVNDTVGNIETLLGGLL